MSLGVVVLGGNCPWGSCPMGVIVLQGSCPRGSCPQGSCPRGSCPRGSWPRTTLLGNVFWLNGGGSHQPSTSLEY